MSWFNIFKQPKLKPASKIKTNITGSISDDEPCKERYLKFLRKLAETATFKKNIHHYIRTMERYSEQDACELIKAMCGKDKLINMFYAKEDKLFKEIVCGE
tara:strand:+ start:279 stop:581 length:303 start_codon:yes stop_codon:yes gene_type:complete